MYGFLVVLHILVSVVLVLTVLLQAGRGAELGAAFGGMGQTTYGRGQTTFIAKFTTGVAVVFMVTSLSLAFLTMERTSGSVLATGTAAPAAGQSPAPGAAAPEGIPVAPATGMPAPTGAAPAEAPAKP
jgi:preprotein translocase subunit SecG